jgi:NAD(P)-dependent dehydrogenase (short-subunit alcohol dehydrogenase family)
MHTQAGDRTEKILGGEIGADLAGCSRSLALELESTGIKVNAVWLYQDKPQRPTGGRKTLEEGAREAVRVTLLGSDPERYVHALGKRNDPLVTYICL